MNQKLSDWASVAEILGAAAIVVSLVFVGVQIRGNVQATQAATFQQHMTNEVNFLEYITSDLEVQRVYDLIFNDPDALPTLDRDTQVRAYFIFIADMRLWENLYIQRDSGTLSDSAWETREPIIRSRAMHPFLDNLDQGGLLSGVFAEYLMSIRNEGRPLNVE